MTAAPLFLFVLLLAGSVLLWEARTGSLTPRTLRGAWGRMSLFFVAAVVGSALLLRIAPGSVLLAMALVPVTALSLFRVTSLARRGRSRPAAVLGLALALAIGLGASLHALPQTLDERVLFEQIFYPGGTPQVGSIDPDARRVVRL